MHHHKRWFVTLLAGLLPFASSLFYFVLYSGHPMAQALYALTKVFTLIWPIIALKFVLREPIPRIQLSDVSHRRAMPLGILVGLLIVLSGLLLLLTPVAEVVAASSGNIRRKASELGVLDHYWLYCSFLAVLHSAIEEYYWRFFVFGQLRLLLPKASAHLVAALLFSLHHIVVTTQFFPLAWGILFGLAVGIGGLGWSLLYEKQNTLAGSWVSHMLVDLGIFAIGARYIFS